MSAYAIAHLEHVDIGPAIVEYLERIDSTLRPFSGRFLVHGGGLDALEGEIGGDVIVIAFPDIDHARGWYSSPAYQAILPLRTNNSRGIAFLVNGVPDDHKATDVLAGLHAA